MAEILRREGIYRSDLIRFKNAAKAGAIKSLKEISEDILEKADNFPSLHRNCRRILANIKMLELNVSDINNNQTEGD